MQKRFFFALALPLALGACEKGPTDPHAPSQVSVKFSTSAPSAVSGASGASSSPLVVQGSNGALSIEYVGFIVAEMELERLESACDNSGSGNLCDDYEAPILFVKLPLSGGSVTVATDDLPAGTYDELDFEVEDVEVDADDDAEEKAQVEALLTAIRTTHGFSDFPSSASMVVLGTFTPTGGQVVPFKAYFDAEIKVELRFDPALTISDTGASRTVAIDVLPGEWFKLADGRVMDLSELDWAKTGKLVEFEMESQAKKGFQKVKIER